MHSLAKERSGKRVNCSRCGSRLGLCGEVVCPIIKRVEGSLGRKFQSESLFGASPPSVFIGTWNYPKVYAGPMVPHMMWEDTTLLDNPVQWLDEGIEDIISHRLSLTRSHQQVDIHSAANPGRSLSSVQELAMASLPVDTEVKLEGAPKGRLSFSRRTPPMGPTATIKELKLIENPHIHPKIEYLTGDKDCFAKVAVSELYNAGISSYQLIRLLSVGLLGKERNRRLVPTKWSITAVDDVLGKQLHKQVTDNPIINEYWVWGCQAVGNRMGILFLPTPWMFEVLEYWIPGTIFTAHPNIQIPSDYEFTKGRKTYAKIIGGAYYAARLPVLKCLNEWNKQAGAIIFLEVHPEWLPLGVWRVREICRRALSTTPIRCESLDEAIEAASKHLTTPIKHWTRQSKILRCNRTQRTLLQFI
jgi:hypothetical protein